MSCWTAWLKMVSTEPWCLHRGNLIYAVERCGVIQRLNNRCLTIENLREERHINVSAAILFNMSRYNMSFQGSLPSSSIVGQLLACTRFNLTCTR